MHPLNDDGSMIDSASVLTAPPVAPPAPAAPPNLLAQINNQPVANDDRYYKESKYVYCK